jgi:hypothetical protein
VTHEKRKHERLPLPIAVLWEGAMGKREARTADISESGCFIDTIGQAAVGETIRFTLCLPAGDMKMQGEVVYEIPSLGFGLRFSSISDEDQKRLEELLKPRG